MKPVDGRLQTGEHILSKIIEDEVSDARVVIAKFNEDSGLLEMSTSTDLREMDKDRLQSEVNEVIGRNLQVTRTTKSRQKAEKEVDLGNIPSFVQKVTIVEIEGFDKRPCRDPHVENTSQIGTFRILKLERVGNERYRFTFDVG